MPGQMIGNATGAFSPLFPAPGSGQAPQYEDLDCLNSGATTIALNQWVGLDITGTTTHIYGVTQGLHGANANTAIGIAIDAIAAGSTGRVITYGPAPFIAGTGGVAPGNLLTIDPNAGHDGQLIAASGTLVVATILGMALSTTAVGVVGQMWVFKA